MRINRGNNNTARGNRKTIYCEGKETSDDNLFYRTLLGANIRNFQLEPMGSSNTLLCFAKEAHLISSNDFCLIDRDFRSDDEVSELERKYKIKFLPVHEIESLLLNPSYLSRLSYFRKGVNIESEIQKIIEDKKIRFLADFLQFRINTHLDVFPRISKLEDNELGEEEKLIDLLLSKLDYNYQEVQEKINEIKDDYISHWKVEFETLERNSLPAKEIFKALKNRIFNNPPKESDIVKDIATLMEADGFMPPELIEFFK